MTGTEMVSLKGNTPITNSLIIAEGTNNQHKSVIRLIREYQDKLERWGKIYFSDLKSPNKNDDLRGRPTQVAILNEQQATFLITLLKNTEIVVDFKSELVDQFYKMREILTQRQNEEWRDARKVTKNTFRELTDTIRDILIPQMIAEGASDAAVKWVYKNYVSMIQRQLGIVNGTRDELPSDLLYELGKLQQMAKLIIRGLHAKGMISHQIYVGTKSKLEGYAELSMFNQRFLGKE